MVSKAAASAAQQRIAYQAKQQADAWEHPAVALDKVAAIAKRKMNDLDANSRMFTKDTLDVIPRFALEELTLGRVLGRGGYGTVREVCAIRSGSDVDGPVPVSGSDSDDLEDQKRQDHKFIADHCTRKGGETRYCIKTLSPECIRDEALFVHGVADMALETALLSALSHPHIITMRAFGANGMFEPNYFIVLDRLYDTLEKRIVKWRVQSKKAKGLFNSLTRKSSGKLDGLMVTKLSHAYNLAGAFHYLHQNKVIHRDLKPENVGFNIRDDIILFDFGLSREVHDKDKVTDSTWKLTGETGSLRYMAPEVADNRPYGPSADMYSFAIMLWEMLAMATPFPNFNKKMHTELIVGKGVRPTVTDSWGPSLNGFLKQCWHEDPNRRPTAGKASAVLKGEASKVAGGKELDLNHFGRKSTFVNRDALREVMATRRATE